MNMFTIQDPQKNNQEKPTKTSLPTSIHPSPATTNPRLQDFHQVHRGALLWPGRHNTASWWIDGCQVVGWGFWGEDFGLGIFITQIWWDYSVGDNPPNLGIIGIWWEYSKGIIWW